jgi:hypothetical protein
LREGFAQLGEAVATDQCRQQQAVRLERAADLDQRAGQIIHKLQRQRGHHQIERAVGERQSFLVGGDSLSELREAFGQAESEVEGGVSPRVAPVADVRELGALLQRAGLALPVVDSDRLTVRYKSVFDLMRDLRRMGATNVLNERRRKPLRRATLQRMVEIYGERFADADGRLRATFEIAWLSGWAPHESQQKPLKPGSAKQRLADALGTREIPAGEKPRP